MRVSSNIARRLLIAALLGAGFALGIALATVAAMVQTGLSRSANTLVETRAIALGYSLPGALLEEHQ